MNGTYLDDAFYYFKIYYSPAYDGKQFQGDLGDFKYAQWVVDYMTLHKY